MDQIILDFEKNTVIWNTDTKKGVEECPGLSANKQKILDSLGAADKRIISRMKDMDCTPKQAAVGSETEESCPWYEVVWRILLTLLGAAFIYGLLLGGTVLVLWAADPILGWWSLLCSLMAEHPVWTVALFVAGYPASLYYLLKKMVKWATNGPGQSK